MNAGTVPCLRCRREVRADRARCPFCGEPVVPLPGVIVKGYDEGVIVTPATSREMSEGLIHRALRRKEVRTP